MSAAPAPARAFDPRRASAAAVIEAAPPPQAKPAAAVSAPRPDWLERERVGAPYEAKGKVYVPTPEPGYEQTGRAVSYQQDFAGKATASGEAHDPAALTGAHPTLPIPSLVQITNLDTGREAVIRINDRGPFETEALVRVSQQSADALGMGEGARVHVRYLGPAPRRVATAQSGQGSSPPKGSTAPVRRANAPGQGQGFVVQVGAFSAMANAERARDTVRAAGVVTVEPRQSPAGTLYRVRLGPWASRAEAEAAQRQVADRGFAGAIVTSLN